MASSVGDLRTAVDTGQPAPVDLLLEADAAITMEDAGVVRDAAVVVDRGAIVYCGPREIARRRYTPRTVHADPNSVILPGLVNAHTHVAIHLFGTLLHELDPRRTTLYEF